MSPSDLLDGSTRSIRILAVLEAHGVRVVAVLDALAWLEREQPPYPPRVAARTALQLLDCRCRPRIPTACLICAIITERARLMGELVPVVRGIVERAKAAA
ncbi:MAG TPA: hypothetical protein VGM56_32700 [Byssovorax sp.]|jgi:hypothetical protein